MSKADPAERLSGLFDGRALRSYARWKVRIDPAYAAVMEELKGRTEPLVDVGCGVGLLAFYLREHGFAAPIIGLDFDDRKVEVARRAAQRYRQIDFVTADARTPLPPAHNVVILDVLQYFDAAGQQQILTNAADAAPPGGVVILRQGIRDGSWRHRLTVTVDALGRLLRWMRAERLNFPSREEVMAPFSDFSAAVRPLRGKTPYNNYLFVFTKRR